MRYVMNFILGIEEDYLLYLKLGGRADAWFEYRIMDYKDRRFVDRLSQFEYEDVIQDHLELLIENIQAK